MATQQERAELHKTIWKIANDLRGAVDGWEFKAYVLGSIFYRFISENICNLSVSSYVEQEDTREVINITEVNAKLETLVAEGNELNQKIEAIIKELGE